MSVRQSGDLFVVSFSLIPQDIEPSGCVNFSRISEPLPRPIQVSSESDRVFFDERIAQILARATDIFDNKPKTPPYINH